MNAKLIITLSAVLMGGLVQADVIIDSTTLNGGFESGTTSTSLTFSAVDDWSNFRPEDGDELRCRRSTVLDGASNRAHSGEWGAEIKRNNDWSYQAPMQNTGHIIQAGDVFSLEAYIIGAWNWDSGVDRVRMNLFAYDDDGTTLIGVGNLDAHTDTNWSAWTHVTNTFAAVAGDSAAIGRELHIRFQSLGTRNESAFLDDVTLTVIPEPATLGIIASFGGALIAIRRLRQM